MLDFFEFWGTKSGEVEAAGLGQAVWPAADTAIYFITQTQKQCTTAACIFTVATMHACMHA